MSNFQNKVQKIKKLDNASMITINWMSVAISMYLLLAQIYRFTTSITVIYFAASFLGLIYVFRLLLATSIRKALKEGDSDENNHETIDEIKKLSRNGLITTLFFGILIGNMAVTHLNTEQATKNKSRQNEVNTQLRNEIKELKAKVEALTK